MRGCLHTTIESRAFEALPRPMSGISRTTLGGAEFELLCRGDIRNYSFNPANISSERNVKHIKRKLLHQLEETVRELEFHSDKTIAKIYIGKTFIQRRRRPGGRFVTFDPTKHQTWKKNGISSRWGDHKHQDYGRDGLVVLGAITKQTMPEKCRRRVHQEDFALAMEQKLLHHYLLSKPDSRVGVRVVNKTFTAGRAPLRNSYAYAIYMAFRYSDTSSSSDQDDHRTSDGDHNSRQEETPSSPLGASGRQQDSHIQRRYQEQSCSTHRAVSPHPLAHPTSSYSSPAPDSSPHSPPPTHRRRRLCLSLRQQQRANIRSTPTLNTSSHSSSSPSSSFGFSAAAHQPTIQPAQVGESSRSTRNRIVDWLHGSEPGGHQSNQETSPSESNDSVLNIIDLTSD